MTISDETLNMHDPQKSDGALSVQSVENVLPAPATMGNFLCRSGKWRSWLKEPGEATSWFHDNERLDIRLSKWASYRYHDSVIIWVVKAAKPGQGHWRAFWRDFIPRVWFGRYSGVFVDAVMTDHFAEWFRRQPGIIEVSGNRLFDDEKPAPCFWLPMED